MRQTLTVLVWVSISWLPLICAAGDVGPAWEADLQSYLERAADALEVPGAAVVVVTREGGATILTHGVRCAGGRKPVTPQTSFGLGSLTSSAFPGESAGLLTHFTNWKPISQATDPRSIGSVMIVTPQLFAHLAAAEHGRAEVGVVDRGAGRQAGPVRIGVAAVVGNRPLG